MRHNTVPYLFQFLIVGRALKPITQTRPLVVAYQNISRFVRAEAGTPVLFAVLPVSEKSRSIPGCQPQCHLRICSLAGEIMSGLNVLMVLNWGPGLATGSGLPVLYRAADKIRSPVPKRAARGTFIPLCCYYLKELLSLRKSAARQGTVTAA